MAGKNTSDRPQPFPISQIIPPQDHPDVLNPADTSIKCRTVEQPDGGIQVSFLIEPTYAYRIRLRANGMSLERYLWENILKRAIVDSVY